MQNFIPAEQTQKHANIIHYAFQFLEQAAQFAIVPISNFRVGAIAIDDAGQFYFGANWENEHAALGQTIHAEQSAIAHAWMRGARRITDIIVNYTPCGHCRQFMNELRGADQLRIHLPERKPQRLRDYLPDSFGPDNLAISARLLDPQQHNLHLNHLNHAASSEVIQAALSAARQSYAPYSQTFAGVALQSADGEIFAGRYGENAAYNPSLPPLQNALNLLRLAGKSPADVQAAALVCSKRGGHVAQTQSLWSALSDVTLQVAYFEE